jgi:hypothetical protein
MKQRTRIYYSDAQKAMMWERWKQGWTLHQIAQLFNRAHRPFKASWPRLAASDHRREHAPQPP